MQLSLDNPGEELPVPDAEPTPQILRGAEIDGTIDPISGLATRRQLIATLNLLLEDDVPGVPPALILLDLDRFKQVNDSLGPVVCDRLLGRVAQRLVTVVPEATLIARVSGDGFAILLRDAAAAAATADRLLDVLGRPFAIAGHAVTLGASIGVATAGQHGKDAFGLIHAADLAMHHAEQDGRNRVRCFDITMQHVARARQTLESDLRAAMALQHVELRRAFVSEQFEVYYQPQVCLGDGRLTGFEALVRWRHKERGYVPPSEFIPLAEEIGLIDLLGDWVLRTACRDAMSWPEPGTREKLRVAVNVSPVQLRDGPALLAALRRALDESRLSATRLEVELTEAALSADPGETLVAIRRLGIDLALDDFGTGYSSLGRLRRHPFNRIKIDRSFVADLNRDGDEVGQQAGEWTIRAIAALGKGLDLATVVEGIETAHQVDIARRAGCTEMQGYLVSRPVPASGVADLIRRIDAAPFSWER